MKIISNHGIIYLFIYWGERQRNSSEKLPLVKIDEDKIQNKFGFCLEMSMLVCNNMSSQNCPERKEEESKKSDFY